MKKLLFSALLMLGCAKDKPIEPRTEEWSPLLGVWYSDYHLPSETFHENQYLPNGEFRARHHIHRLDSATGKRVLDTVEASPFRYTFTLDGDFLLRYYHPESTKDSIRGNVLEKFSVRADRLRLVSGSLFYGSHPGLEGRWENRFDGTDIRGEKSIHVVTFQGGMFSDSTLYPTLPGFGTVPRSYRQIDDSTVVMQSNVVEGNDTLEFRIRNGRLSLFLRALQRGYSRSKPALPCCVQPGNTPSGSITPGALVGPES